MNYRKIIRRLQKNLDEDRFEHTLGVAATSMALAMRWGVNPEDAYLAGLLHDCAKCIPNSKKVLLCEKYGIHVTDYEKENPTMLHSKLGAFLAAKDYHVSDDRILSAILNHTTGAPQMPLLDEIVFLADYIEPRRDKAPRLAKIRSVAFEDMQEAIRMVLEDTLSYLRKSKGSDDAIDPQTAKTYEYYLLLKEEEKKSDEYRNE